MLDLFSWCLKISNSQIIAKPLDTEQALCNKRWAMFTACASLSCVFFFFLLSLGAVEGWLIFLPSSLFLFTQTDDSVNVVEFILTPIWYLSYTTSRMWIVAFNKVNFRESEVTMGKFFQCSWVPKVTEQMRRIRDKKSPASLGSVRQIWCRLILTPPLSNKRLELLSLWSLMLWSLGYSWW